MSNYNIENRDGWWYPTMDTDSWDWLHKEIDNPNLVAAECQNHQVVVQAGGHCGLFIRPYSELFEIVYTFEPTPINFHCLVLNAPAENVIKMQACVGNSHKLVALKKLKDHNTSVSRVSSKKGGYPTVMIDDLALEVCDLIHLDIEGYEFFALQGAVETIKRCKPVIVLEWLGYSRLYGIDQDEIVKWLGELGYMATKQIYNDMVFKLK
jgi:FkbM family methyltransferase